MTRAALIGASASGTGKTSLCVGLGVALRRRGLRVRFGKVGPDYLDPFWLQAASGYPCVNLDPWMHGWSGVHRRFNHLQHGADVCLIEGVMGLYDGPDARFNDGSSADVARFLNIPVLFLADAQGCSRSYAALVKGFCDFPGAPRFAGYLANRVGSQCHARMLCEALSTIDLGGQWFGALPQCPSSVVLERHLGLIHPEEMGDLEKRLEMLGDFVEAHVAIEDLLQAIPEITLATSASNSSRKVSEIRCRIAVAKDAAFNFYYPEMEMALRAAGVKIEFFSPMQDDKLPDDVQGVVLGGGYPELYARQLSMNHSMRRALNDHAEHGGLIYAECGGLMYLSNGIIQDQERFPMLGILPVWTHMEKHMMRLGYVEIFLRQRCILGNSGNVLRGHEFHYSRLDGSPRGWNQAYLCRDVRGGSERAEGWCSGNILASYVHLPLDVFPDSIEYLVRCCQEVKRE